MRTLYVACVVSFFFLSFIHGAKRLWANRPWGEMSSAGRNVHGRNVHGAKRQYMGRKVLTPMRQTGASSAEWPTEACKTI